MNVQFTSLIENAPNLPGIYKMFDINKTLLYIGKAKNLHNRLKQYVNISKLEPHKQIMRTLVYFVEWQITDSENDALILEEKLIKKEKPKYNIMLKDNKMYPMLYFSKSEFPALVKFRGKQADSNTIFGPYPSVKSLNSTIKIIQKIFLIRTCNDNFMKNRTRPCLLYQIKRCSAPCCIKKQDSYKKNIQLAKKLLTGDINFVLDILRKEMQIFSQNQEYEQAILVRDKIKALTNVATIHKKTFIFKESFLELQKLININFNLACVFDNSHLFGTNSVGAMIVFDKNGFVHKLYKHFKLQDITKKADDVGMMQEFLTRVFEKQNDFDLIILDGGINQWNIAKKLYPNKQIISVKKGDFRDGDESIILNDKTIIKPDPNSKAMILLRLVRNESHRFAISFHKNLRNKNFIKSELDEIRGIGTVKKRILLNYFGTVPDIMKADITDLLKVPKLGVYSASLVYNHFHK